MSRHPSKVVIARRPCDCGCKRTVVVKANNPARRFWKYRLPQSRVGA